MLTSSPSIWTLGPWQPAVSSLGFYNAVLTTRGLFIQLFHQAFFFTCNRNKQLLDSKETQFGRALIELWDYVHREILLERLLFLRSVQEAVDEITMLSHNNGNERYG